MAVAFLTDAVLARALFEDAIKPNEAPVLPTAEVTRLFNQAASINAELQTVYYGSDLNRAAVSAWRSKQALLTGNFTVALEGGMKFNRELHYDHCKEMAELFETGKASVLTSGVRRRGGIGVITLASDRTVV